MKRPICPYCKKEIRETVIFQITLLVLYYLKAEDFGTSPRVLKWYDRLTKKSINERENHEYVGLSCRSCGKSFSKKVEKEIWAYIKFRHLLKKLKGI